MSIINKITQNTANATMDDGKSFFHRAFDQIFDELDNDLPDKPTYDLFMAFLDKNDLSIDDLHDNYFNLGECAHLELDKKDVINDSATHNKLDLNTAFFNLAFAGSLVNYQHFGLEKIIYRVDDFSFHPIFDPNGAEYFLFNEFDKDECIKLCKSWCDDFMTHIFGIEYKDARKKYIAKLTKNINENNTENDNKNNNENNI